MKKGIWTLGVGVVIALFFAAIFPSETYASGSWTSGTFSFGQEYEATNPSSHCTDRFVKIGGVLSTKSAIVCVHERPSWRYGFYTEVTGPPYAPSYQQYMVVGFGADTAMYKVMNFGVRSGEVVDLPDTDDFLYNVSMGLLSHNQHQLFIVHDLPSHLVRSATATETVYNLTNGSTAPLLQDDTGDATKTGGINVSKNSKWIAVEVMQAGLVLVDTQTYQLKLFSNYRHLYGHGSDTHMTFAVSNDGRHVGMFGSNLTPVVYTLETGCTIDAMTLGAITARLSEYQTCPTDGGRLLAALEQKYGVGHVGGATASEFSYDGDALYFIRERQIDEENSIFYNTPLYAGNYTPSTRLQYLAMGDSYSSGEGDIGKKPDYSSYYRPLTDADPDTCHISSRSYPFILRDYMGLSQDSMKSVACSGAQVVFDYNRPLEGYMGQNKRLTGRDDISLAQQGALEEFIPGRVPQLEFVKKYQPGVITLTGGGNDVGFARMLSYCAYGSGDLDTRWKTIREGFYGLFTCDFAKPNSDAQKLTLSAIDDQYNYTISLLKNIKDASPTSKVYLIGYPSFISDAREATCLNSLELNSEERAAISYFLLKLNDTLRRAADAEHIKYVDIQDSLAGGRLCEGSEYMTGPDQVDLSTNERSNTFHPNYLGHRQMAGEIERSMDSPVADTSAQQPSAVGSDEYEGRALNYDATSSDLPTNGTIQVEVPIYTFKPQSLITVTLHSDPIDLGTLQVDQDGAINTSVIVKDLPPGFHFLTLTGESYSGELLTMYQFVTVGLEENTNVKSQRDLRQMGLLNIQQDTQLQLSRFEMNNSSRESQDRPLKQQKSSESISHVATITAEGDDYPPLISLIGLSVTISIVGSITFYVRHRSHNGRA